MSPTETTVLSIIPAQQCAYCPRLATVALIMEGIFSPVCPLHGYVHPRNPQSVTHAELQRQSESVRRFVLWMYDEQGRVTLVSPVHSPVRTISGYQELARQESEEDQELREDCAFYVGYVSPAGKHAEVYVIWSGSAEQFFLYQNGKEISDRACTWIESHGVSA